MRLFFRADRKVLVHRSAQIDTKDTCGPPLVLQKNTTSLLIVTKQSRF
nr:MAG TPA: hypothetical protein [Caudoviricetes sp.]